MLTDYGLKAVFFVEPLFSTCFGPEPLHEIIDLLSSSEREIQLHLHTEWVDESKTPLLPNIREKRQHLRYFTLEEQTTLINKGLSLLRAAGVNSINAFRAGSFGFNCETLLALAANGITYDSSYNASYFGLDSGVMPGVPIYAPIEYEQIQEYPMTVFKDGFGKLRHTQISACSFSEIESTLWRALESGYTSVIILSHNFELLNQAKDRPDWITIRRLEKLCQFLDKNKDCFTARGFQDLTPQVSTVQPRLLTVPRWATVGRLVEQLYRRRYQ